MAERPAQCPAPGAAPAAALTRVGAAGVSSAVTRAWRPIRPADQSLSAEGVRRCASSWSATRRAGPASPPSPSTSPWRWPHDGARVAVLDLDQPPAVDGPLLRQPRALGSRPTARRCRSRLRSATSPTPPASMRRWPSAAECDFVVIDTPGADTELARAAHQRADLIVTPMNDSFVDFDVLGVGRSGDASIWCGPASTPRRSGRRASCKRGRRAAARWTGWCCAIASPRSTRATAAASTSG